MNKTHMNHFICACHTKIDMQWIVCLCVCVLGSIRFRMFACICIEPSWDSESNNSTARPKFKSPQANTITNFCRIFVNAMHVPNTFLRYSQFRCEKHKFLLRFVEGFSPFYETVIVDCVCECLRVRLCVCEWMNTTAVLYVQMQLDINYSPNKYFAVDQVNGCAQQQ